MKRYAAVICVIVLAIVGFAAWNVLRSSQDPISLTIWHVYGSDTRSPFSDAVAEFNKTRGAEIGVSVTVTSILSSETIDSPLLSSVNGEPGAPAMPDLFTAYPRSALKIGLDRIIDWRNYLSPEELASYVPEFLTDSAIGNGQYGLPVAKSATVLFVNETAVERFLDGEMPIDEAMSTFEDIFEFGRRYARATGRPMIHFNDFYTYFLANMASDGAELVKLENGDESKLPTGKIDITSPSFMRAFMPLAEAAALGAVNLTEGYGSEFWMTGDVIAIIGSSAGLMYMRDFVAHSDGSREDITTRTFALPPMRGKTPAAVSRGSLLYAFKSNNERRNKAIAEFARWITTGSQNLKIATNSGYMPVTTDNFSVLSSDMDGVVESTRDRYLYRALLEMRPPKYIPISLPLYENVADRQARFEQSVTCALRTARAEFDRVGGTDDALPEAVQAAWKFLLNDAEDLYK